MGVVNEMQNAVWIFFDDARANGQEKIYHSHIHQDTGDPDERKFFRPVIMSQFSKGQSAKSVKSYNCRATG